MRMKRISLITTPDQLEVSWVKQDIEILKSAGWDVLALPIPDWCPSPLYVPWMLRNFRSMFDCDVVFGWFAYPVSVFIARAFGKPIVLNAVGWEVASYPEFSYGLPSSSFARALVALGLQRSDHVIAISKESARWSERWGARNVSVIYEGIDTARFRQTGGAEKSRTGNGIATVAYLTLGNVIRKDLTTLLRALKLVRTQVPNARLTVLGEKKDGYAGLVALAKDLGILDAVEFKGWVEPQELVRSICTAEVFAMPSLQEGFPTALCEALSCGVPIVTTNRPAMNEIFEDRVHALFVKPRDPEDLARAMIALLTNKRLARTIAHNGAALVEEKFSRELRARKLTNYFIRVMNGEKHGRSRAFSFAWMVAFLALCIISPMVFAMHKFYRGLLRHAQTP
jgi:glycosyltransferase involved in cell wall biosynthesis